MIHLEDLEPGRELVTAPVYPGDTIVTRTAEAEAT